jgi:hypothetical protein
MPKTPGIGDFKPSRFDTDGSEMGYDDWNSLLMFTTHWRHSLTHAVVNLIPSYILCHPWFHSEQVRDYLVRKHIFVGLLGSLVTYYQQPEPCEPPPTSISCTMSSESSRCPALPIGFFSGSSRTLQAVSIPFTVPLPYPTPTLSQTRLSGWSTAKHLRHIFDWGP